jgi:hypothetical protein
MTTAEDIRRVEICEHSRPVGSCGACWPQVVLSKRDRRIADLEAELAHVKAFNLELAAELLTLKGGWGR